MRAFLGFCLISLEFSPRSLASSMEVIRFSDGEFIYRASGDHNFRVGSNCVVEVVQISNRIYRPLLYSRKPIVKNLCGRFMHYLYGYPCHGPVLHLHHSRFGRPHHMYHIHGTVSIYRGLVQFKGCAGYSFIRQMSQDIFLEEGTDVPRCQVHMGVFKVCLGRTLSTARNGFFENRVSERFRCLRVQQTFWESPQAVRLHVDSFDTSELPILTGKLAPTSLDVSVTWRGVAIMRFSWSRCDWNEENEAAVLRFCEWMSDALRECC